MPRAGNPSTSEEAKPLKAMFRAPAQASWRGLLLRPRFCGSLAFSSPHLPPPPPAYKVSWLRCEQSCLNDDPHVFHRSLSSKASFTPHQRLPSRYLGKQHTDASYTLRRDESSYLCGRFPGALYQQYAQYGGSFLPFGVLFGGGGDAYQLCSGTIPGRPGKQWGAGTGHMQGKHLAHCTASYRALPSHSF